jgi:hypothetical protein
MKLQIFTSANLAYAPQAAVMLESIRRFEPTANVVLILVDEIPADGSYGNFLQSFDEVVTARELLGDLHDSWMAPYSVVEACTSVKGPALEMLLERGSQVIYLDPDTALFAPLEKFCEQLACCSILLTPHQLRPNSADNPYIADEIDSLRHGIYNFGVFGVRSTPEGQAFAKWWSQRLAKHSVDDPMRGLFTDQKWGDHIPVFFPDSEIHREAGLNIASWNLHLRPFSLDSFGNYLVDGSPLVLYHFSKITHLGKAASLPKLLDNPLAADLIRFYLERLEYWTAQFLPK